MFFDDEEKRRRQMQGRVDNTPNPMQATPRPMEEMTTREALEAAWNKQNPYGGEVKMTGPLGDFSYYDENLNKPKENQQQGLEINSFPNTEEKNPFLRPNKKNFIGTVCENYLQTTPNSGLGSSPIGQMKGTVRDYCKNYIDMRNANLRSSAEEQFQGQTADNYYHCKANYDSTKRGPWGELAARTLGYGREIVDVPINLFYKNLTWQTSMDDRRNDLAVNFIGRQRALNNRYRSAQEACNSFKPTGLNEEDEYRKWYR